MKSLCDNNIVRLEPSDWRYSAAIVGLIRFFNKMDIPFIKTDDYIEYSESDINEENYLKFVEKYYDEELPHKLVEQLLKKDEFTEDDIFLINCKIHNKAVENKKIKGTNTIMKNTFKNVDFDGTNKEELLEVINENRNILIKETFRNKKHMYCNFCNPNMLLEHSGKVCRINGYYVDLGKKGKAISYNFNMETLDAHDEIEFDFIPFAFSSSNPGLFINNNMTIDLLLQSNNIMYSKEDAKYNLVTNIIKSSHFLNFDVEIISKATSYDKDFYFESLYLRKKTINVFKKIKNFDILHNFRYELYSDFWISIDELVIDSIINELYLDNIIEVLLKNNTNSKKNYVNSYKISKIIDINNLIYKEGDDSKMTDEQRGVYGCAKAVVAKFVNEHKENKIFTYRQKLISAVVAKDYNRTCDILLQLANYSGISFGFAYKLFENFEENKNLVYTFINALEVKEIKNGGNNNEE